MNLQYKNYYKQHWADQYQSCFVNENYRPHPRPPLPSPPRCPRILYKGETKIKLKKFSSLNFTNFNSNWLMLCFCFSNLRFIANFPLISILNWFDVNWILFRLWRRLCRFLVYHVSKRKTSEVFRDLKITRLFLRNFPISIITSFERSRKLFSSDSWFILKC